MPGDSWYEGSSESKYVYYYTSRLKLYTTAGFSTARTGPGGVNTHIGGNLSKGTTQWNMFYIGVYSILKDIILKEGNIPVEFVK